MGRAISIAGRLQEGLRQPEVDDHSGSERVSEEAEHEVLALHVEGHAIGIDFLYR